MNIALILVWASMAVFASNTIDLLHQLPACSVQCIMDGIKDDGCDMTDLACQCTKLGPLTKTVSPCLIKAGCSHEEMAQMTPVIAGLCEKQARNSSHAGSEKSAAASRTMMAGPTDTNGMATQLQLAKWVSAAAVVMAMLLL